MEQIFFRYAFASVSRRSARLDCFDFSEPVEQVTLRQFTTEARMEKRRRWTPSSTCNLDSKINAYSFRQPFGVSITTFVLSDFRSNGVAS